MPEIKLLQACMAQGYFGKVTLTGAVLGKYLKEIDDHPTRNVNVAYWVNLRRRFHHKWMER